MKCTPETLVRILDLLCGCAVIKRVCEIAGVAEPTYFMWWSKSRKNDPTFIVEWMGETRQFADHLKVARDIYLSHLESAFIERMSYGTDEKIFWQGKPSWQLDHQYEGWTDEDMSDMGLNPIEDRYLHDPKTGARLQHAIHHEPPIAGALATLAAHSKKWQNKTDLNVSGKVALGVSVVGNGKPPIAVDVTPRPKQIAPPVEHVIEHPVELSNEAAATLVPEEASQPDRVKSSPFYKAPPPGSSKIPQGKVPVFAAEAMGDDPVEVIGTDTQAAASAEPALAPVRAPPPDIMQHVLVRQAKRAIHEGKPPESAVQRQIMIALQLPSLSPEQRTRRLQELTGSFHNAESRSEGLGAGLAAKAPMRMV